MTDMTVRRISAALVLVAATMIGQAGPAHGADAGTTVAVDAADPSGRLPADFVGLCYEMRELASWCRTGECVGTSTRTTATSSRC
jgi:hypothetical protein